MNTFDTLNDKLLEQTFDNTHDLDNILKQYKQIAYIYSKIENSIAVLSDLKANKSYIYNGAIASYLGILDESDSNEINSIWEDELFNKIHPDDLLEKHLLELHFFHFIKNKSSVEQSNYQINSHIRMRNQSGEYIAIEHRMFYVCSSTSGNPWLALCLYNFEYHKSATDNYNGIIVNTATGEIIKPDKQKYHDILSDREKEILALIRNGKMSREIANTLSISKHTVDRHRQNILEKLRVNNSIEACRIAELMNLF